MMTKPRSLLLLGMFGLLWCFPIILFKITKVLHLWNPLPFPVTLLEEIQSKIQTCSDFCTEKLDNAVVICVGFPEPVRTARNHHYCSRVSSAAVSPNPFLPHAPHEGQAPLHKPGDGFQTCNPHRAVSPLRCALPKRVFAFCFPFK